MMTGRDIRELRTKYELTRVEFAALLGVAQSTVYRWESHGSIDAAVDPSAHRLMLVMRDYYDVVVAVNIKVSVNVHGPLYGLHVLLRHVFSDRGGLT